MKMKLFEDLTLKFENPNWANNPEFGLIDTILEARPDLIEIVQDDLLSDTEPSDFGRGDTPSIERIVRAAIYKELKNIKYRELEYQQGDSRICGQFLKIDGGHQYSFQTYQKYISKIKPDSLDKLLVALNKIAIEQGFEDLKKLRMDSTVVESNIHHPTNNSLVWDCIKESHRLLSRLSEEVQCIDFRDYRKGAKKAYFKINVTKGKGAADKRTELFRKQLVTFTKCINQVSNAVKKKRYCKGTGPVALMLGLERLLPLMEKVYGFTEKKEINKEQADNKEKLFSIYELHTDIIVKGGREVKFGHKVNLSSGASSLLLSCDVLEGNPSDSTLYQETLDKVVDSYERIPRDSATDGGYASKANMEYADKKGVTNIMFNKIVGSLKNRTSSLNMETRLKKWRSGMEAVISNLKRKFKLRRCNWKGYGHFRAKVLWSAIAYNIRVMTGLMLEQLKTA